MTDAGLHVLRHGPSCVDLQLDRPAHRNALDTALLRRLRDEIVAIGDDRTVKVVVLTGAGPTFCAGADTREFGDRPVVDPADTLARVRLVIASIRGLLELEAVTIAAVQGAAVGAGWGLALGCDVCWAADDASFALPEVAKGYRIPRILVTRLGQVVGTVRAAELVLTGRHVGADEAVAIGAVTRRFGGGTDMRRTALEFATELAGRPQAALRGAIDPLRTLAVPNATPEIEYQWPEGT